MDLTAILIGLASEIGAPLVRDILDRKIGGGSGRLAEAVVKSIATHAGAGVEQLPDLAQSDPDTVKSAIELTEALSPELIGLYAAGLEGQFALLQAETAEGPLQSGWRWGWMYLLALFWIWVILVVPTVRLFGPVVETVDLAILMTLTSWFLALYMGGHTIKELGKNVIDAVRSWKAPR